MVKKIRQFSVGGKIEPVKVKVSRTAKQLVEQANCVGVDIAVMAKEMSTAEVQLLIDCAAEEDIKLKAAKKFVDVGKKLLMAHAREYEWKTMAAKKAVACISAGSSTTIEPLALLRKLRELDKKQLFSSLFKAAIGPTKKYLGADEIEDIAEIITTEYGSISLKKLQK